MAHPASHACMAIPSFNDHGQASSCWEKGQIYLVTESSSKKTPQIWIHEFYIQIHKIQT
jgi:hypothetical protein